MMTIIDNEVRMINGDAETITVKKIKDGVQVPFAIGDKVTFSAKKFLSDETYALHKEITEFVNGEAIIEFQKADTQDLYGAYVYDIQINLVGEDTPTTLVKGSPFIIEKGVTD